MQKRILISAFVFLTALTMFAWGKTADYTDEGFTPFIPITESLGCLALAFVLYKLSYYLMNFCKDDSNGCLVFISSWLLLVAIVLACFGWYILLAVGIISMFFHKKK